MVSEVGLVVEEEGELVEVVVAVVVVVVVEVVVEVVVDKVVDLLPEDEEALLGLTEEL